MDTRKELNICICHGAKKHMLDVYEDTTIQELAVLVSSLAYLMDYISKYEKSLSIEYL